MQLHASVRKPSVTQVRFSFPFIYPSAIIQFRMPKLLLTSHPRTSPIPKPISAFKKKKRNGFNIIHEPTLYITLPEKKCFNSRLGAVPPDRAGGLIRAHSQPHRLPYENSFSLSLSLFILMAGNAQLKIYM